MLRVIALTASTVFRYRKNREVKFELTKFISQPEDSAKRARTVPEKHLSLMVGLTTKDQAISEIASRKSLFSSDLEAWRLLRNSKSSEARPLETLLRNSKASEACPLASLLRNANTIVSSGQSDRQKRTDHRWNMSHWRKISKCQWFHLHKFKCEVSQQFKWDWGSRNRIELLKI